MLKSLAHRLSAPAIVGIDLGSAACKIVELGRSGGRVTLRRAGIAPVVGEPAALIRRVLGEAGISATQAAVAVSSPEVVVKPFDMPPMPRKELADAVLLEAEASILNGHARTEVAIDWHTLGASRESVRGVLAVVPRVILEARVATLRAASIDAAIVDVEGLALWNAYWALDGCAEPQGRTVMLVNVGARTTTFVIARTPDALMLVRDVHVSAPAREPSAAQEWLSEIGDSLGYARAKSGLRGLDAVRVVGGGAGPEMLKLLEKATHADVGLWNPLAHLSREPSVRVNESLGPLFAVAIGLALRRPS